MHILFLILRVYLHLTIGHVGYTFVFCMFWNVCLCLHVLAASER